MCDKRNQIIAKAALDVLGSGMGIYTAEEVLIAANIDDKSLQELLRAFQKSVANVAKEK